MRFGKQIKICKGLSINLSKSGASLFAGRKGASINIGSRGTYINVGFHGTGLSTRKKIGPNYLVIYDLVIFNPIHSMHFYI